jgi:alkanesulfonate monooxygenase SsuD/methylene tetrahydromethanopterin reductase-like flavin-dependent oxidoreductase (luciferase family)
MQYGISLPNFGICGNPRTAIQLASIAEEAGWDAFFLWDHVLWTSPEAQPAADPFVTLGAIGAVTSRIKLGTMVTPVPRRRPWQLARQLIALDHLTEGRVIAGVGLGGDWFGDYSKFGETTDRRTHGEMLDEGLDIIAGLWSGESFSYEGKHFTITDVQYLPVPVQQPRIPVWVAGTWPNKKPFQRAAKWDGVFPLKAGEGFPELTLQDLRDILAYMEEYRSGDGPFDLVHSGRTTGSDRQKDADRLAPFAELGATWWIEGFGDEETLEAVRERLEQGPPRP